MKPPSSEAIQTAISILLRSITEENKDADTIFQPLPKELEHLEEATLVATSQALTIAQTTLQAEFLSQVAAIHKQLNTLRPIHRLHRDLFEDILLEAINMGGWSVASLHRLARVSTSWRDIVRTSPRLWAVADIGSPPAEVALALRKSASALLRIDAVYRLGFYYNPKEFLKMVIPHVGRCAVLAAGNTRDCTIDGVPEVSALFEHDFPELVDLRLESVWTANSISRRFWGDRLRRVHLQATALAWNDFSGLTHLTIDADHSLAPNQLLKILASSPDIEVLSLRRLSLGETATEPPTIPRPQVKLPRLKQILIESSTDDHIDALLSSVVAESLQKLHIWAYNRLTAIEDAHNTRPIWFNSEGLQRHIAKVSRNAGLPSLNVVIDPVEIVTVAEREFAESVVAVSVHMRNLPERWWGLLESIKLPLRMFVPSLDNRGFFQPCMLGDLTTLEELEIGDTYAYPVLLYLTAPINSDMPCPQLRKLTLIVDVRWGLGELVAKLLRARKISCRELTVYDGDDQVFNLESGSFRSQ
ncbi:hypothetical protein FRC04_000508 [Tulasnella sp. 424]|nr:hypothetical protein FRC04_000508 [Tulasnella sp. 424]KAG8973855.1 hypothetical protein FRC05_008075 [Tulasnella sp. 425]